MTYETSRLTTLEETTALVRSGIDPDINTWDDETLQRASDVLDRAQQAKIERLSTGAICKCGHKRNGHSKFINGLFTGCQECECLSFQWSE